MPDTPFNTIPCEFYTRTDVVQIARELLGKVLYTSMNNEIAAGIIIETEAYAGIIDKASHAYNNRRTQRTGIMYREGGFAYVYLCYGIHALFNIVTSVQDDPHAVLIRSIEPLHGTELMQRRKGMNSLGSKDGIGPGNSTKLLGIQVEHSGLSLFTVSNPKIRIWLQDEAINVPDAEVKVGPRVGVGYAAEDALLPYRFQWIKKQSSF
jgi:DNA-3-methyladenine glycosylase